MSFQQEQSFASDDHPSMIHVLVAAHDFNKNIIACVAPAGNHFLHRHRVVESAGADNFQAVFIKSNPAMPRYLFAELR